MITWLDDDIQAIVVPTYVPREVLKKRTLKRAIDLRRHDTVNVQCLIESRSLELVCRVHPSAYRTRSGTEDVHDVSQGIRFNYVDRTEPCYTGVLHEGNNNFKVWIDECEDIRMKCYSAKCSSHPPHFLGRLHGDTETFFDTAFTVELQYLQRCEGLRPIIDHVSFSTNDEYRFNVVIDQFLQRRFHTLCIRSGMGTGKSYLLTSLMEEVPASYTVLVISYRQSLAYNLADKLPHFHNYLDGGDLSNRTLYPRIICQLDSLERLTPSSRQLPVFDFIVLDEVESLLNHFSSRTLKRVSATMSLFVTLLRHAKHVLVMDALLGQQTFDFLTACDFTYRTVVNSYRTTQRTFAFTSSYLDWQNNIIEDLKARKNIVVVSMSTEALHKLVRHIAPYVDVSKDVIIHTSKQDDELKKRLMHVNDVWSQYRVVMYSPTIESGVDFTEEHFDGMYVFACLGSTTHLGLFQMTGRVRTLRRDTVSVFAQTGLGISSSSRNPHVTVAEQLEFMRWIEAKSDEVIRRRWSNIFCSRENRLVHRAGS